MDHTRVRVAVYVTRECNGHRQVLVYDHESGTQVPAGRVDPDEPLSTAALREVAAETGLTVTRIGLPLAVQQTTARGGDQPGITVFFHATTDESRDKWTHTDWECFFLPLAEARRVLSDRQGEFVDLVPTLN
jgi:ADP-ribose pyrophosphatase YjhB (NUDIX family)